MCTLLPGIPLARTPPVVFGCWGQAAILEVGKGAAELCKFVAHCSGDRCRILLLAVGLPQFGAAVVEPSRVPVHREVASCWTVVRPLLG